MQRFPLRAVHILIIALAFATVAVFVLTNLRASPTSAPGDYSDLILHLDFEQGTVGATADQSRSPQPVTVSGGSLAPADGLGSAMVFDGLDDYITIPHANALMPTSALTVMAWVYPDAVVRGGTILAKRSIPEGGGYALSEVSGGGIAGYQFEVYHADIGEFVRTGVASTPNTWHHVVGVFDGSTVMIYEDGVSKATKAYSGNITAATSDLTIGVRHVPSTLLLTGKLDEVQVYNRALSPEEIACAAQKQRWVDGACAGATANRPPVVVSITGSTTVVPGGAAGTWTATVYDPDRETLMVRADWGDGTSTTINAPTPSRVFTPQFSHPYSQAGTYTPTFRVSDTSGRSATASASVVTVVVVDTTPPGTPTGLAVQSTDTSSAVVEWRYPADDVGVVKCVFRRKVGSFPTMTESDWTSATDELEPYCGGVAAGTIGSTRLLNFTSGVAYTVGLKACDAAGNCSGIATAPVLTGSTTTTAPTATATPSTTTPTATATPSTPPPTTPTPTATATTTSVPITTATSSVTTSPTSTATATATATGATTTTTTTTSSSSGGGGGGGGGTVTTPTTTATTATTTPTTAATPSTTTPTTSVIPTTTVPTATATHAIVVPAAPGAIPPVDRIVLPFPAAVAVIELPRAATATAEERATQLRQILQEAAEVFVRTLGELAEITGVEEVTVQRHAALVEKVVSDAVDEVTRERVTSFVALGTQTTQRLGAGERAGVVGSFRDAFGREPQSEADWADTVKIANGRFPSQRSSTREDAVRRTFLRIYLRAPDFENPNDAAAMMMMAYGMRPEPRSMTAEQSAIRLFRRIVGRAPSSASDWDAIRAIAYSGARR